MVDGTSRHVAYFDQLAKDAGYAGSIETDEKKMASSHRIKRFFKAFAWTRIFLFRRLLQTLFIWRLRIKPPDVIELGLDTMVMWTMMMPTVATGLSRPISAKKDFNRCR